MRFAFVILPALALFASLGPVRANINFTLGSRHEGDGAPDPENHFITDGDNHIYLRIPRGWTTTSNPEALMLWPDQTSSEVQISQVNGAKELPLDPSGVDILRQKAQAALPPGAKEIKGAGEQRDLLPILGWKSYEFAFDYEFFSQQMRRSILFINMLPGRVIQVIVTSANPDFDEVHEKMRKMMFGWFEPNRDLTPDEARDYESGEFKGS